MRILNLTLDPATTNHKNAGVEDLTGQELEELHRILKYDGKNQRRETKKPSKRDMKKKADELTDFANRFDYAYVMAEGSPYFLSALQQRLKKIGITLFSAYNHPSNHYNFLDLYALSNL